MLRILFIGLFCVCLSACTPDGPKWQGDACNAQLSKAYKALYAVKQKPNFTGTKEWTIASGLLTAAETDYELGQYYTCLKRVNEAMQHIDKSTS